MSGMYKRSHHFTANAVMARFWCNRCKGQTDHKIDNGRLHYCIPCHERKQVEAALQRVQSEIEDATLARQGRLF